MDNFFLSKLVEEITPHLLAKRLLKVLLVGSDLFFDFRLPKGLWLRAALETADSALLLEQSPSGEANDAHPFIAHLTKELVGESLISIEKPPLDRIAILRFETFAQTGVKKITKLILSFAGRYANAYLTDADDTVEAVLKPRGKFRVADQFTYLNQRFDSSSILQSIEYPFDADAICKTIFNSPDSSFSPFIKQEFLARSKATAPLDALTLLFKDLSAAPSPLLYAGFQIPEIYSDSFQVKFALEIKNHLLLSHFPLTVAVERGLSAFEFPSLSEAAATYYAVFDKARLLKNEFTSLKKLLSDAIKKVASLSQMLGNEREKFSDPDRFKRYGDLLLAQLQTAKVENHKARVINYYDENQDEIEIAIGEGKSIQQAAADYFALYQKARRAQSVIAARELDATNRLQHLTELDLKLNEETTVGDLTKLRSQAEFLLGIKKKSQSQSQSPKKAGSAKPIGRWFRSTTGYEIVVGRNDKDNDAITFRLARSQDIWLHAADYPGSHVIIRNPNRQEIPIKVVQEAAELAAFHSHAKEQNKVAVHYTQKKFVTKPPRAKPGLVRLSAFKTISVEPKSVLEKIEGKVR